MNASTMSLAACLCYRALDDRAFCAPSGFWQLSHERGCAAQDGHSAGSCTRRGWQIGRRDDAGKSKKRGTSLGPIAHLNAANARRSQSARPPFPQSDWLPSGLLVGLVFFFHFFSTFLFPARQLGPSSPRKRGPRAKTSSSDANHYCS